MSQDEKTIFSSSLQLKPNKIFIYKGEEYEVDFTIIKRNCQYFYNLNSEIKSQKKYEIKENIDLPSETIQSFLSCSQNQRTTINDFLGMNYLSIKYQNKDLKEFTDRYIENHFNELIFQSFLFKQKIISSQEKGAEIIYDTSKEEEFFSSHFLEHLEDEKMFKLPIQILDRILKKFLNENKEIIKDQSSKEKIDNFLLNCLRKYGRDASVLFLNVNFDKLDGGLIVRLHNEFANIMDFGMINAKALINTAYDLIGEISQFRLTMMNLNNLRISEKNDMDEYKAKIDKELKEIRQQQEKIISDQLTTNESQAKFSAKIQNIEESQNVSLDRIKSLENKRNETENQIQDIYRKQNDYSSKFQTMDNRISQNTQNLDRISAKISSFITRTILPSI